MNYIIIDLEWNNAYASKVSGFINEVFEIGAVMLNEELYVVDTFSCFIRPQISKRLRGKVKRLTNTTNEDVFSGITFNQALSEFGRWVGDSENIILTWGDADIRVLMENNRYINSVQRLPFLSVYADLQKLFHRIKKLPSKEQPGLVTAAEIVGINVEIFSLNRALDDSLLSAEIFRRIFDAEKLKEISVKADDKFYDRLEFKPHNITRLNHPLVDKTQLSYNCKYCGLPAERISEWKYSKQYFRADFFCDVCNKEFKVGVRFRKYFERLEVSKTVKEITDLPDSDEKTPNQGTVARSESI